VNVAFHGCLGACPQEILRIRFSDIECVNDLAVYHSLNGWLYQTDFQPSIRVFRSFIDNVGSMRGL